MNKNFDFWNHGIHPITGFFIGDDRIVEYNYNKYIIDTFILPKNKYNMKIQLRPVNHLFSKTQTA